MKQKELDVKNREREEKRERLNKKLEEKKQQINTTNIVKKAPLSGADTNIKP